MESRTFRDCGKPAGLVAAVRGAALPEHLELARNAVDPPERPLRERLLPEPLGQEPLLPDRLAVAVLEAERLRLDRLAVELPSRLRPGHRLRRSRMPALDFQTVCPTSHGPPNW